VFRWDDIVYTKDDAATYKADMGAFKDYNQWRTYQMSDHRPKWVELTTDYSTDYLNDLAEGGDQPAKEAVAPAILPIPA
jgi:hypothetical protein